MMKILFLKDNHWHGNHDPFMNEIKIYHDSFDKPRCMKCKKGKCHLKNLSNEQRFFFILNHELHHASKKFKYGFFLDASYYLYRFKIRIKNMDLSSRGFSLFEYGRESLIKIIDFVGYALISLVNTITYPKMEARANKFARNYLDKISGGIWRKALKRVKITLPRKKLAYLMLVSEVCVF